MTDNKDADDKKRRPRSATLDFPMVPLTTALEICEAIRKLGGTAGSYDVISDVLKVKGGALNMRITAARRYGLVDAKQLTNTELALRILKPVRANEDVEAKREAILSVDLFKKIYERFGSGLPEEALLPNILTREYKIPETAVRTLIYTLKKNAEFIGLPFVEIPQAQSQGQTTQIIPSAPYKGASGAAHFPIKITSAYGTFDTDITDDMDWDAVDAYIKALRNKWDKKNQSMGSNEAKNEE
jgi:hypothetical protein